MLILGWFYIVVHVIVGWFYGRKLAREVVKEDIFYAVEFFGIVIFRISFGILLDSCLCFYQHWKTQGTWQGPLS